MERGEAPSCGYVQKIKNNLKHIFTKIHQLTTYTLWNILFQSKEISPTVLPIEILFFLKCL